MELELKSNHNPPNWVLGTKFWYSRRTEYLSGTCSESLNLTCGTSYTPGGDLQRALSMPGISLFTNESAKSVRE